MEQPDHDIESPMANTDLGESGHDGVPPDSDGGAPGRGSLVTEAAAGTVGGVVAGSLVGWGTAGIAAAGAAVALPLAGAVAAGGLIAVGGVTVARRLGVPVDQAAHGAGRAAVTAARAVGPAATTAAKRRSPSPRLPARHGRWARPLRRRSQGLQVRGHRRGTAPEVACGQVRVALTRVRQPPGLQGPVSRPGSYFDASRRAEVACRTSSRVALTRVRSDHDLEAGGVHAVTDQLLSYLR